VTSSATHCQFPCSRWSNGKNEIARTISLPNCQRTSFQSAAWAAPLSDQGNQS
jgi:hypothetical protein